jgi:hypothetical protein
MGKRVQGLALFVEKTMTKIGGGELIVISEEFWSDHQLFKAAAEEASKETGREFSVTQFSQLQGNGFRQPSLKVISTKGPLSPVWEWRWEIKCQLHLSNTYADWELEEAREKARTARTRRVEGR